MSTAYHSKYFAHELTQKCSSGQISKLNQSILNATVDLNPHQIEAARILGGIADRNEKFFEAEIDEKKEGLISEIERRLKQTTSSEELFTIRLEGGMKGRAVV